MSASDMSIETASATPAPETSAAPAQMPTIQLSFSSGPGGAWDDRELINAANSAMKEFHVHHPGPGSWLDKATAAMAAGKPLPGANDFGTSWYTTSAPSQPAPTDATGPASTPSAPPKKKHKANRLHTTYGGANPYDPSGYEPHVGGSGGASAWGVVRKHEGAASPSYMPVSPGGPSGSPHGSGDGDEAEVDGLEEEEEESDEWQDDYQGEAGDWQSGDYPYPALPAQAPAPFAQGGPSAGLAYGVYPHAGITHEAALGHAMTAQYWAGYWMGVAQATQAAGQVGQAAQADRGGGTERKGRGQVRREEAGTSDIIAEGEGQGEVPSNVVVTRQQFAADTGGLRR